MRVACLFVPDFRLQARLRTSPDRRGRPLVLAETTSGNAVVLAVSYEAHPAQPGLTVAQARGLRPDVDVIVPSEADERAARAALVDVAHAHAPEVEEAADCVWLSLEGVSRFASEAALGAALEATAARVGLRARVGVASGKEAARVAARACEGVTVIPPGDERAWLASLPLAAIEAEGQPREILLMAPRLGLRSIGDLAALPSAHAAARFGPDAVRALRVARGEAVSRLAPRPAPIVFQESMDLDYGEELCTLEPLAFVLRGVADRLAARLALRHLGARSLRLTLRTEEGVCERVLALAAPTREASTWVRLLRLRLEKEPPPGAVSHMALEAIPERVRAAQASLFEPPGPAPEALATTIARLQAMGASAGTPTILDAHRIDVTAMGEPGTPGPTTPGTPSPSPRAALHLFRPPISIEVLTERDEPAFVRAPGLGGRVVHFGGPWRLAAEWWSDGATDEDLFDAELSDGGVYLIGRDRRRGEARAA
ncbi:MAG: DNA polymerase Y family protein, partial [Myxococcota bacterium]